MFRSLQTLFTRVQSSKIFVEPKRTTIILRRTKPIRLNKIGTPYPKKLKRKSFFYEVVEDTECTEEALLDILLLKNVKSIGNAGDVVSFPLSKAYDCFLVSGAGVLATPENFKKYGILKKDDAVPIEIQNLLAKLNQTPVPVFMHVTNPWTIQPWHVKLALRKFGIFCNEDCIKLPEKPITGPNPDLEKKDFAITVTVNKMYSTQMRCRIFHMTFMESNFHLAFNPKFYLHKIQALFPEEQSLLENLPLPSDTPEFRIIFS